jgi:hypothetical protein
MHLGQMNNAYCAAMLGSLEKQYHLDIYIYHIK